MALPIISEIFRYGNTSGKFIFTVGSIVSEYQYQDCQPNKLLSFVNNLFFDTFFPSCFFSPFFILTEVAKNSFLAVSYSFYVLCGSGYFILFLSMLKFQGKLICKVLIAAYTVFRKYRTLGPVLPTAWISGGAGEQFSHHSSFSNCACAFDNIHFPEGMSVQQSHLPSYPQYIEYIWLPFSLMKGQWRRWSSPDI